MAVHKTRRSTGQLIVIGLCTAMIAAVVVLYGVGRTGSLSGDYVPETALVTAPPSSPEATPSETPKPAVKGAAAVVNPWCWQSRKAAETARCQAEVAKRTKFVDRYETHQAALAAKHTIVKAGPTGTREANSLSRHGLLICWMAQSDRHTLEVMVTAFTYAMHPHQYTIPDPSDGEWSEAQRIFYAATQIHMDAIQTICPELAAEYEAKGGPVVAEDLA